MSNKKEVLEFLKKHDLSEDYTDYIVCVPETPNEDNESGKENCFYIKFGGYFNKIWISEKRENDFVAWLKAGEKMMEEMGE